MFLIASMWLVFAGVLSTFTAFYLSHYEIYPSPRWAKCIALHTIVATTFFIFNLHR